ncbi:2-succinylbenzoate--CoA ligase [Mycena venus]|uniref:2-succinylbenzoate--CoA ligase n=1 Tax=Mycena venus TaxID=2733690 RepID=A0A8H6Y6N2_9AGAR|nr:2-succinylbenzoate--CoA ligase [Mycena venus]
MSWHPKRTLAEVDAILCAPGQPLELETILVDGRVQRVYKNQWPSVRQFWLWSSAEYANKTYLVFENQRYTYKEVFDRSLKSAAIFRDVYGIRKGEAQLEVGICSRNYPEYTVSFFACHLLGAVPVLINAWLPIAPLIHCLTITQCKLIILDSERADRLEPEIKKITKEAGATGVVVMESHEGKGNWKGMQPWETIVKNYKEDPSKVLQNDPKIEHEDNCLIIFTSGTTGLPKGVLSTQRQFLTNTLNAMVARRRALLRRGENIPAPSPQDPQPGILIAVPFFSRHDNIAAGDSLSSPLLSSTQASQMSATLGGGKVALLRKWNPKEAARLIREEKLTTTGGVPSMSVDLIESDLKGYPLESMTHGGAPAAAIIAKRARAAFPDVILSQGYGMTECNSIAASFAGDDYDARPTSTGFASPVNDLLIVKDGKAVPRGEIGEIWIRGPNVMKGYWRDQATTDKAVTKDGWLMSGDIGLLDEEGFLYIRDRIKDIIIRGGENIDSSTVENALFSDGIMEVAAVAVPDEKLGELVAAVVSLKPEYRGKITEQALIALARTRLPNFAVPVMVVFQAELPHNPAGKVLKSDLRELARREWGEKRTKGGSGQTLRLRLDYCESA